MTVDRLQKAKETYKSESEYFNRISFTVLAEKFKDMSDLCSDMIEVQTNYDKLLSDGKFSKEDMDKEVIKSVAKIRRELLDTLDDFYTSGEDAHMETVDLIDTVIKNALGEEGMESIKSYKEE